MKPNTTLRPMTLQLMDEGTLLAQINQELGDLQASMVHYAEEFGEAAIGAKGKLSLEIVVAVGDGSGYSFQIKSSMKTTKPARPASISLAIASENDDGQPRLFVRASGSDITPPEQRKLCTRTGEAIDPDTGEVLDKSRAPAAASAKKPDA